MTTLFFSCSNDDDNSNTLGNSENTSSDSAPVGEIVALELRNATLTGFTNLTGKNSETQKWWKYAAHNFEFSDACFPEGEPVNNNPEVAPETENMYHAFYPNGKTYTKIGVNGTPQDSNTTWAWTDETQTAMYFGGNTSQALLVTYLNDDNVAYEFEFSENNCSIHFWFHYVSN